jgi:hypothetical protein
LHERSSLNFKSVILKQQSFASGHADQSMQSPQEARFDREGAHLWTRCRFGATPSLIEGQTRSGLTSKDPESTSS